MDPVEILPPEVSSDIIAYASLCQTRHYAAHHTNDVELLLEMTLVSSSWQHLILTTPKLWADIVIDGLNHDAASKLVLQCDLSREHSLSVTVPFWATPHLELFLPLLSDHIQHRVQELSVFSTEQLELFLTVLDTLHRLTSLKVAFPSILEENVDILPALFIDRHPHLKVIRGFKLDTNLLTSNLLPCLQQITIVNVPLCELVPYLDALSNVRSMVLELYEREDDIPLQSYRVHTLPSLPWTRLTITGSSFVTPDLRLNVDVLLPALARSLTELNCPVDFQLLSDLLPRLAGMLCLSRLSMVLYRSGELTTHTQPLQASLVKVLSIQAYFDDNRSSEEPLMTLLISMLLDCFCNATSISLYGAFAAQLIPLLGRNGLPQLRAATLEDIGDVADPDFTLSPKIQVLELKDLLGGLEKYRSEDVQELRHTSNRYSSNAADLELNPHFWPRMARIHTPGRQSINWTGASFTNLSAIALTKGGSMSKFYQGTRLLYFLAVYPCTFPALVELELVPFIEWDVFFSFLERRNAHNSGPYVRLQAITFSRNIPFGFPELTSRLLFGDNVERPSNLELSWIGNLEIFHDLNLPGCLECIKTLRHCEEGVILQPSSGSLEPSTFDPYPSNNDDVLSTWPAREAKWEEYVKSQQRRKTSCRRFSPKSKTTIRAHGYYVNSLGEYSLGV